MNMYFQTVLAVTVCLMLTRRQVSAEDSIRTDLFVKVTACFDPSVTNSVSYQPASGRRCAAHCAQRDGCKSYSVNSLSFTCYLNDILLTGTTCTNNFSHYNSKKAIDEPRCLNNGIFINSTYTCKCINSYVGDRCERLMQDCSEGFTSGHYTGMQGMFTVQPMTSPVPLRVRCQMQYGGRTFLLQQSPDNPYLNFTRTWMEYKNGFGDMENDLNFYVGNEIIHLITTNRDHEFLFDGLFDDPSMFRQYIYKVQVAGESENYRLDIINKWVDPSHALDDCFPGNNIAFSTIDRDNDASAGSCAHTHMSGWWFDNCGPCNPTGQVQPYTEQFQSGDPTSLMLAVPSNLAARLFKIYLIH